MKNILLIGLLLTTTVKADILSVHCPLGCPVNPGSNDLIFAHHYALSNNSDTKFADWVAYEVDVINFGDSPGRKWKTDPLLEENETLEAADYKKANSSSLKADRGHQAPLASFAGSRYWPELNRLSNITPQNKNLNQGPWKRLEDAVRAATFYRHSLFVITGPVYEGKILQLPKADEPHRVPSGYYKIIYDIKGRAAIFFMQQTSKKKDDFCSKQKTLNFIQAKLTYSLPYLEFNNAILKRLKC